MPPRATVSSAARRLDVPGLEALTGAGVFYGAATAEARALTGQEVYVVEAGNSAGQAAIHLARYAARITLLVRGETLAASMSDYLVQEIARTPNITVLLHTRVVGVQGGRQLTSVSVENVRMGARDGAGADNLLHEIVDH